MITWISDHLEHGQVLAVQVRATFAVTSLTSTTFETWTRSTARTSTTSFAFAVGSTATVCSFTSFWLTARARCSTGTSTHLHLSPHGQSALLHPRGLLHWHEDPQEHDPQELLGAQGQVPTAQRHFSGPQVQVSPGHF